MRKKQTRVHDLPQAVFDRIVKMIPVVGCELVIFNSKKEVLLIWRHDEYYRGWHTPGGLLRFKESFGSRIQKVARNELGVRVVSFRLIDVYNFTNDPRGHAVGLVFLCKINGTPRNGTFFKVIPKNALSHQKPFLKRARALVRKK